MTLSSTEVLKLNLGCGRDKKPGYLNVDKFGDPDLKMDLEEFPWPWEDNSVGKIVMEHVLEHLGQDTKTYLGIIKELYRICRHGAVIHIVVPHPRHDNFIGDPTHVRAVTPQSLDLLSKKKNLEWQKMKSSNSLLALELDVDFEIQRNVISLEEPWRSQFNAGKISQEMLQQALIRYNNVSDAFIIDLKVIKE